MSRRIFQKAWSKLMYTQIEYLKFWLMSSGNDIKGISTHKGPIISSAFQGL